MQNISFRATIQNCTFLGRDKGNPVLESKLMQGANVMDKKVAN